MYIQPVPFRLALLTLNINPDTDRQAAGRLIGVEGKTIERALAGGVVSEVLIANSMAAFALNADRLVRAGLTISIDQFFVAEAPAVEAPVVQAVA